MRRNSSRMDHSLCHDLPLRSLQSTLPADPYAPRRHSPRHSGDVVRAARVIDLRAGATGLQRRLSRDVHQDARDYVQALMQIEAYRVSRVANKDIATCARCWSLARWR
jgi:hypothetical protein